MLWTAFGLLRPQPPSLPGAAGLRRHVLVLLILIIGMLTTGGFTAGLDGGKIYNSFPLMGGSLVPGDILAQAPLWSNPFENPVDGPVHPSLARHDRRRDRAGPLAAPRPAAGRRTPAARIWSPA